MRYEKQYIGILRDVMMNGYEDGVNQRTGVSTKRLPNQVIKVDLKDEFPILQSKHVQWKTSAKEILWIMQKQSNRLEDLDAHIWDDWADEEGTIGKAYGYQAGKSVIINGKTYKSQVHYVLETLAEDPSSRRAVITLWGVEDLGDMRLTPCCHTSTWNLDGGRLNCLLDQRSGDLPYGVPFNTTQYAILTHLFASHLGVEPGVLLHVIADAHIYDRQFKGVRQQLMNYNNMSIDMKNERPHFEILQKKDFFDYTIDDFRVTNYQHMGKVSFGEVVQ